jgi:4-hydroxy-tetrahydrodipicolinate reductase
VKSLKLALFGGSGRMGRAILQLLAEDARLAAEFKVVFAGNPRDKDFAAELKRAKADVAIDFTIPEASLKIAAACASAKLPLLVCTTGFTPAQRTRLENLLKARVWAYVPNTSLGVEAFAESLKTLAKSLPADYSFSVWEAHHTAKRDAPSGTAKMLAEVIRSSSKPARQVEVHSVRGGTEPGLHRVTVLGPFEKLELVHAAQDRRLFAQGALVRARSLLKT